MASTRELVAAHTFTHRRLVGAFVSGSCRAGETRTVGPGRAITIGIALTVLLFVATLLTDQLRPQEADADSLAPRASVVTSAPGQRSEA